MKKLLSTLLAALMMISVFSAILPAAPAEAAKAADTASEDEEFEREDMSIDILKVVYKTPEDKLADMKMRIENEYYQLYVRAAYGEIAVKDKRTGQILFSNPYDIASTKGSSDTKAELMSQIILEFTNGSKTTTYNSYTEAALREQIVVKNIKNGVRVEYTLGKTETRWLVPQMITAERFEEVILTPIRENTMELQEKQRKYILDKFEQGFYSLKDVNDPTLSKTAREEMLSQWPILKKIDAIYVLGSDTRDREYNMLEGYIKMYAPDYTFEELDYDHDKTDYESNAKSQPLFRMAVEYTLDKNGITQTLAASSISFDETTYTLNYLKVNPWFGAGNSNYNGFSFIPDGSGTLIRFQDVDKSLTLTSKVYGSDFSYHQMDPAHRQTIRMPVYGVVEEFYNRVVKPVEILLPESEWYYDQYGYLIKTRREMQTTITKESRGYFAILTEGDALAEISTVNGAGSTHVYSSVQTTFYPRPTDSYSLSEAMGAGSDEMWSVSAKRKYTGNYTVKYYLLSDSGKTEDYFKAQEEAGTPDTESKFYEATYMGMVNACRDYLEENGLIQRIDSNKFKKDIPMTIETLGVAYDDDTILTIPVTVKRALTSFDDIKTMYNTLAKEGVTNLNFKLTGYANGGLDSTVPYRLKWERKAGGAKGFNDLMAFAEEKDIGIYPEFDFSYIKAASLFDGFSYKQHAAKTMDNRYPRKYYYDPAYQMTVRRGENPISASVFKYFYNKFGPKLLEYKPTGISVASLGSDLNSDFDKKDAYNREDSKDLIVKLLARMKKDFGSVMISGGNSYAVTFADYILEMPLDSSQYLRASESIPFMGMVLHGYVQYTGTPLNTVGNINYEILKTIENGASPYFLLAYQNTEILKKYYNKYYSVNFTTWAEAGLVDYYKTLNDALHDVQDKRIVNHEFIDGVRVLTEEEIRQREEDEQRRLEEESIAQSIEDAKTAQDTTIPVETEELTEAEITGEAEVPTEEATETLTEAATEAQPESTEKEEPAEDKEEDKKEEVNPEDIVDNGKIVRLTYENGKVFILNYNSYAVTVEGYDGVIDALGFVYFYEGGN